MTTKIYIPNIGEEELEVIDIMVKIKDKVHIDQPLLILEGDKTSLEIPASNSGIVNSIMINIGDKVKTGTLIMIFENIETTIKEQKTITITDTHNNKKINLITQIQNIQNNTSIMNHNNINNNTHATPLIRHMARVFGINLTKIIGTGRKGRIIREDVHNYIKNYFQINKSKLYNTRQTFTHFNISSWPKIKFDQFGNIEITKLKKIQKISGSNLHRNWIMVPHVTQFDEIDITELENFRKQKNKESEKEKTNLKITPLMFIMKATAQALEILPQFNSSLSEDGEILTIKKYINIGIAVNTENGLIVPVIKDINKKNIITLTKEFSEILKKIFSDKNKLTPSDMKGGCFTISSLGKLGGTGFTPIINVPEVAILGISKTSIKPIWNGKKFIPRLILPLALSYDHRVINGVDGAKFMRIINNTLSDIRNMIM